MYLYRGTYLVSTEVGIAYHGNVRLLIEEPYAMGGQLGDIIKCLLIRMAVDKSISQIEHTFLSVQNVHSGKVLVFRLNAYNLLRNLDSVAIFSVKSGDEGVGIAILNH